MFHQRKVLVSLFDAAVKAAAPQEAIIKYLPAHPKGRTVVVGAGKAASQMAAAFEVAWESPLSGLVVTRYGHAATTRHVEVVEAGHPVPDELGLATAERMIEMASGLGEGDLLVALMSGGGSALLPAPANGLTLSDEQALTRELLSSGAPIGAMNIVRGAISRIKSGRLAVLAYPARVETLIVSDVPGDDPADVAGGPTVGRFCSRDEVLRVVRHYDIKLPTNVSSYLNSNLSTAPKTDDNRFSFNRTHVIASANLSLKAAAARATSIGWKPYILSDAIEGEAREVARVLAAITRSIALDHQPFGAPCVILSGGETTVTVRGTGKGGRNTEFLLSFAIAIQGMEGISAISADTDGIDGSEDNAGAFVDGRSAERMREAGIDPKVALAANDAYGAFAAIGDLFTTGPTGTNVNDFRAILISPTN